MRKSISEILAEKRTAGSESGGSMQEMMQRGIAASEAGDKQTANEIFRQVAQQYPDNVEVWVWLGWSSSNMDEAEGAFTRAAELDPSNEEVSLGLRWVMSQRAAEPRPPERDTPAPEPVQQTWQQEQPAAQSAPAAPVATATTPRFDLSPSAPPQLEDDLPPRPIPTRSVSEMLQQAIKTVQSGDKATAYRMFEHILSVRAGDPDIWVWLGGTSSSLEDAESAFRRAREIDPFNEKATLGLRWVSLRRQVAYASAIPSTPASSPEPSNEPAPRKENVFSRFFKRFTRSS
ncbi:MAG TPA: tetratricopeptide repeat protein [Chloroflexia bacterium]|jgi:tetratricopeptide (TPR) repeat protein